MRQVDNAVWTFGKLFPKTSFSAHYEGSAAALIWYDGPSMDQVSDVIERLEKFRKEKLQGEVSLIRGFSEENDLSAQSDSLEQINEKSIAYEVLYLVKYD